MRGFTVERLRFAGWAVLSLLALGVAIVLVRRLLQQGPAPRPHVVTTITQVLLPPPPPPPTPPPPKEEPQKVEQVQPKEQTPIQAKPSAKARPSKAPAAAPGKPLSAEQGDSPNNYGLAVGNGGGNTVGGGGGGGDPFGYYNGVVAARVRALLRNGEKTRFGTYALTASIWVGGDGRIERAELTSSTGDSARDAAIQRLLVGASIGEPAPGDMPQPIRMRIGAHAPD